jgi:hypothetical protein
MPIPYEMVPETTPDAECLALRDACEALYVDLRGEVTPIAPTVPEKYIFECRASGRLGKISPNG